jgi:hypothetical protein
MKLRNENNIYPRESQYLSKYLRREGMNKIYKYRNTPEIILKEYLIFKKENNKTFEIESTDQKILNYILSYIDYITNVYPKYKKFLKLHNLKSYEIGLMAGFKNSKSWHDSVSKFKIIRLVVTMVNKHEDLLKTLK